jgi:hypothetical protein
MQARGLRTARPAYDRGVTEEDEWKLWSFPEGSVAHDQSVKDYAVEASDGEVGTCSWASYKPGESYLVVNYEGTHRVVPAGAVEAVDHDRRTVRLDVAAAEVQALPEHEDPEAPVDRSYVDQFERGMLGGGSVWPYTDV